MRVRPQTVRRASGLDPQENDPAPVVEAPPSRGQSALASPTDGWQRDAAHHDAAQCSTGGAAGVQVPVAAAPPDGASPLTTRICALTAVPAAATTAGTAIADGPATAADPVTAAEGAGLEPVATRAAAAAVAAPRLADADLARLRALTDTRDLRTAAQSLERIQEIADIFVARGDRRGVFPVAYEVITERSLRGLREGSFEHAAWAEALVVNFAERYFDNLRAHLEGGETTPAWRTHFARAADPAASVSEVLGSGIFAHLVDDLPVSLAEVGSQPAQSEDFKLFGLELLEVYPDLIEQLKRRYQDDVSPLLTGFQIGRWVDGALGEGTTTELLFQGIRQKAWIMGQRLQHDCSEQVARFEMASSLAVLNTALRWVV